MAKAGRPRSATEQRIEAFAEDLGRLLGTARAKADSWLNQREQIAKQLGEIRDTATKLLTEMGHQAQTVVRGARKQKAQYAPAPVSRKRRRKMSAAARAKIAAAQRLRWARQKQESGQRSDTKSDKKR